MLLNFHSKVSFIDLDENNMSGDMDKEFSNHATLHILGFLKSLLCRCTYVRVCVHPQGYDWAVSQYFNNTMILELHNT